MIRFPVPKNSATVTPELGPGAQALPAARGVAAAVTGPAPLNQAVEYIAKDKEVVWQIKKFQGQQEHTLRTRITLAGAAPTNLRKEMGPISMSFEIPMYNTSNLQVRYLRIAEAHKSYKPHRWVRYVTSSSSYVCRL